MAKKPQETHLNAYMTELAEAEKALSQAYGLVMDLRKTVSEKRKAEGLEPVVFAPLFEKTEAEKSEPQPADDSQEEVPEEAQGFGDSGGKRGRK